MSTARRQVRPEPLSAEAWAPFGWLPVADTDPSDGDHRLSFAWNDVHLNIIGHSRGEVPESAAGLRCEMLFRHDTHTQAVMSLDVPAVIVVAPGHVGFSAPADVDVRLRLSARTPASPWCSTGGRGTGAPIPSAPPRSGS